MERLKILRGTEFSYQNSVQNSVPRKIFNLSMDFYYGVKDTCFYFLHLNCLVRTEGGYVIPAELGLSEFNLQEGVRRVFSCFINIRPIPPGYSFMAKDVAEKTHKIPVPDDMEEALTEAEDVYFKVLRFIHGREVDDTSEDDYLSQVCDLPVMFTTSTEAELVEECFGAIIVEMKNYNRDTDLKIYNIELFFYELLKLCSRIHENDEMSLRLPLAEREFVKDPHSYCLDIACQFHVTADACPYCSRSKVIRWGYIISDFVCPKLDIQMIPKQHCPSNTSLAKIGLTYGNKFVGSKTLKTSSSKTARAKSSQGGGLTVVPKKKMVPESPSRYDDEEEDGDDDWIPQSGVTSVQVSDDEYYCGASNVVTHPPKNTAASVGYQQGASVKKVTGSSMDRESAIKMTGYGSSMDRESTIKMTGYGSSMDRESTIKMTGYGSSMDRESTIKMTGYGTSMARESEVDKYRSERSTPFDQEVANFMYDQNREPRHNFDLPVPSQRDLAYQTRSCLPKDPTLNNWADQALNASKLEASRLPSSRPATSSSQQFSMRLSETTGRSMSCQTPAMTQDTGDEELGSETYHSTKRLPHSATSNRPTSSISSMNPRPTPALSVYDSDSDEKGDDMSSHPTTSSMAKVIGMAGRGRGCAPLSYMPSPTPSQMGGLSVGRGWMNLRSGAEFEVPRQLGSSRLAANFSKLNLSQ